MPQDAKLLFITSDVLDEAKSIANDSVLESKANEMNALLRALEIVMSFV